MLPLLFHISMHLHIRCFLETSFLVYVNPAAAKGEGFWPQVLFLAHHENLLCHVECRLIQRMSVIVAAGGGSQQGGNNSVKAAGSHFADAHLVNLHKISLVYHTELSPNSVYINTN